MVKCILVSPLKQFIAYEKYHFYYYFFCLHWSIPTSKELPTHLLGWVQRLENRCMTSQDKTWHAKDNLLDPKKARVLLHRAVSFFVFPL